MSKLKVIVVGIMHDHSYPSIDAMLYHSDVFEVLAISPENTAPLQYEHFDKRLVDFQKKYSEIPFMPFEEALKLEGVEAVVVESRERDLTYYATQALKAGFPVHMDKPGGESIEEFNAMIDLAASKKLAFSLGYMYRQNKAINRAWELIDQGAIGEVTCVEAHMDCEHPVEKRNWMGNYKGGMMFFLGCHLIDLIVRLQGEPSEVLAMNIPTAADGVDKGEDYGLAMLRYPHGWSFAKTSAYEPGGFMRRQLVIIGTKGQIEIKPLEALLTGGVGGEFTTDMRVCTEEDVKAKGWRALGTTTTFGPQERYAPMLLDFASYVKGERENPFTYEYEKMVYRVLCKACGK